LFRFNKPNESKLPFVVFFQVFGVGVADVLTLCNASFDFFCEGTQLVFKNVMTQLLNTFLISFIKINYIIYSD